jgi:hypothetical protein
MKVPPKIVIGWMKSRAHESCGEEGRSGGLGIDCPSNKILSTCISKSDIPCLVSRGSPPIQVPNILDLRYGESVPPKTLVTWKSPLRVFVLNPF